MQFRIFFIILFILFVTTKHSKSQTAKTFGKDVMEFYENASDFLVKPGKKKSKDKFIQEFNLLWSSEQVSEEQREKIYEISDAFLLKKARAYPDYYNYIKTILLFSKDGLSNNNYTIWEKGLKSILNKKTSFNTINAYLKQTHLLLEEGIIYKSNSTIWTGKNLIFEYKFSDNELSIEFSQFKLCCYAQRDSSSILNTSGNYFPLTQKWKGNKGKITWQKAGLPVDKVYAYFSKYNIDMRKNYFSVDTVQYINPQLSDKPIPGRLEDKAVRITNPNKALYPKFESFKTEVEIKNIFPNLNYIGGVSIKGPKFLGHSSAERPARIDIIRNDSVFLSARSENFSFNKNRITATNTEIDIFIDTCRIHHPGVFFLYNNRKKEVNLIRNGEGRAISPYFNNYHNLIMDFEMLVWDLTENQMHFKKMRGANNRQAKFESINYFSDKEYRILQGMDAINPLVGLKRFSKKIDDNTFTAEEYARYQKKPLSQIRQQLIRLSFKGFISYNNKTDEVKIQERLTNYILSAVGKKDYDAIRFGTQTGSGTDNATLDLTNHKLDINGVRKIIVSDSQNVVIFPRNKKITLRKNRNFTFDGNITAGVFNMYGDNFNFIYDDFKVNLQNIDSIEISAQKNDIKHFGKRNMVLVNNVIEKVTGNLIIDKPDNKSGMQNQPEYPIFNSTDTSYVYYDNKSMQNGIYDRDKFYFKVDPYVINSLNRLKPNDLQLKGEFVSYNIFPTFNESLTILEDFSLGFINQAPENGYSAYGKGRFYNKVILNKRGLTGDGSIEFLSSMTDAPDFLFLPEKTTANARRFHLDEGINKLNPNVEGDSIFTKWLPYAQELYVTSTDIPFNMYSDFARLSGTLKLTPYNITGDGKMNLKDAKLESNYYSYTRTSIKADTALFKIYDIDKNHFAFEADSVNAFIDLENESGSFRTCISNNISKFPENNYICYLNSFIWYMNDKNIEFGGKDRDLIAATWEDNNMHLLPKKSMSQFISTNSRQDSLSFYTPMANYDVTEKIIEAKYVHKIEVADANIYPSDGDITIRRNAKMETIDSAQVVTSNGNANHTIKDATIDIHGRKSYSGKGKYKYIDEDKNEQIIDILHIDVDTAGHTYATAKISQDSSFTLSPNFNYKGNVRLNATEQFLNFNGYAKMNNKCDSIKDNWLKFDANIDPNKIRIPIGEKLQNDKRKKIYSSFFIANDSSHIYPSFLSTRDFYSDNVILDAKGFLTYVKKDKSFKISTSERLDSLILPGNMISLNQDNYKVKGRGIIDLGLEYKFINQLTTGNITYDFEEDKTVLDLMYGLNFLLPEQAMKVMQETFLNGNLKTSDINPRSRYIKLSELLGAPKANQMMEKMDKDGVYKELPEIMQSTLLFNNLALEWNNERSSYMSIGRISVGNIGKKQINKLVNAKIELNKRRKGDRLRMFLQLHESTWFYFEYHNGKMYTLSSEEKYNEIILNTDEKGKKKKRKKQNDEELAKNFEYKLDAIVKVRKYHLDIAPVSLRINFIESLSEKKGEEEEGEKIVEGKEKDTDSTSEEKASGNKNSINETSSDINSDKKESADENNTDECNGEC